MGILKNLRQSIEDNEIETEYQNRILPTIIKETRNYINKMNNSSAVDEIVQEMLRYVNIYGIPDVFEIAENGIYLNGNFRSFIVFDKIGLPNLQSKHKFSDEIHKFNWMHQYKSGETCLDRFLDSCIEFRMTDPNLYGAWYADFSTNDDYYDCRPCINECLVLGIIIRRRLNIRYKGKIEILSVKFMREYEQTREW